MTPLQLPVDATLIRPILRLFGFAIGSFLTAAIAALVYRWYVRAQIPLMLSVLFGVSAATVYLNTMGMFGALLGGETGIFAPERTLFNVLALGFATLAAPAGRSVGDRVATNVFAVAGARELDAEVSRLVRSVGRITAVTLPDDVGDIEGYDSVDESTKETLCGKTLIFPRRQTVAELRTRLVTRLKDDYGVGHVDVELDADGTVSYLAVGSRAAGIGGTLAPGTVAVAVRADPSSSASPGDLVQVWRTDPTPTRVVTAELRATTNDVATLAVDEVEAAKLDPDARYRLVTLPAEPQADREFASLLRAADETMGVVRVGDGSALDGVSVESLGTTVAAVRSESGAIETLPSRSRALTPGDEVYVIARPETLRELDAEASSAGGP